MKMSVLFSVLALSAPAFAAQWSSLKSPSNAGAAKVYQAIGKVEGAYHGVKKVVKPTEARGRTAEQLHLDEIKEAMHRYMCSFFDEAINLTRTKSVSEALNDLDVNNNMSDKEKEVAALVKALPAVLKDRSLEVYSGSASGNNTAGEVMGIYDNRHQEVIYLGFTNCGSDD